MTLINHPALSLEPTYDRARHYHEHSPYRAWWVRHPTAPDSPVADRIFVAHYRLRFTLPKATALRFHVSADERFVLWLDGALVARGPDRCDRAHWTLHTVEASLPPGEHTLHARVHSLCAHRPVAQISVRHGFLLVAAGQHDPAADALLSTGVAPWETADEPGYSPIPVSFPNAYVGSGARFAIDAALAHAPRQFVPAVRIVRAVPASARMEVPATWELTQSTLPPMLERDVPPSLVRYTDSAGPDDAPTRPIGPEAAPTDPDRSRWQALLSSNTALTIPPNTTTRVLIDLQNYYCAYPKLSYSGGQGSFIRLHFAEACWEQGGTKKRHRDEITGLFFMGQGDDLLPAGGPDVATYEPLWWLAGRYMQLTLRTAAEPLTLHALTLRETHYPHRWESTFRSDEPRIGRLIPLATRVMEMCSADTFFDCPYYEQLMYVGDSRLEALVTYAATPDDRLPRRAIELFDQSRRNDGWTSSRYPTHVTQTIPPFSLWWVCMVHDHMMWRDDRDFILARMPGVRAVLEAARARVGDDGLFYPPQGWNFVDWTRHLGGTATSGAEPGLPVCGPGPSAALQWQFALTIRLAAELEAFAGEDALAARHRALHTRLVEAGHRTFWDPARSLYREIPAGTSRPPRSVPWNPHDAPTAAPAPSSGPPPPSHSTETPHPLPTESHAPRDSAPPPTLAEPDFAPYTEHAQVLALLAGAVPEAHKPALARALFTAPDLARTTIYFTHYYFEACRELHALGGAEAFYRRLEDIWYPLPDRGLHTTIECPEPTRSDCHAWGAHPLFHFYATVLGIRPAAPGFRKVSIRPLLGPLTHASATLTHPQGQIQVSAQKRDGKPHLEITLPPGVEQVP